MDSSVQLSTEDRLKKLERQNSFLKACLAILGLFFASIIALLLNLSLSARQMKSRVKDLETELIGERSAITMLKKAEEESKNQLIKLDFPELVLPKIRARLYPSAPKPVEIKQTDVNEFVISRKALSAYHGNQESIVQQARAIPNFVGVGEDRKVNGLRIYRIQPGSIYELLGMKNGDVLTAINGHTIDSLEKALMLFQGFWEKDSFTVTIERDGQTFEFYYRVE